MGRNMAGIMQKDQVPQTAAIGKLRWRSSESPTIEAKLAKAHS
jgi:hypothetical protein